MLKRYLAPLGTLIGLLLYLSIIISVKLTDALPKLPSAAKQNKLNVNLTQAWEDLHRIATGPHPYNSRRNDVVAEYILERLQTVAEQHPDVEVLQDNISNGTFTSTYFEGTNILVKIPGKNRNADEDAILFSAHYDSVSTSTGTVDDGIAVVCMLQLVQKFAKDRGSKTAIFNINNGEEDWLNGAKAFMQHPWSNLTSTFLNLEGAASGGRPLLFRSTSLAPVKSFSRSVPHPHTSILAADAFAAGVIRSGTDYSVYAEPSSEGSFNPHQMQGLDLAFYKGRSRYHTKYDAIAWLEGGTYKAVWGMLESAVAVGEELLANGTRDVPEDGAVYFDLFGQINVVFSLNKLRIYNIVFLSVVPIVVILLEAYKWLVAPGGYKSYKSGSRWVRFWFALVLTGAAQVGLVALYKTFNPYVIYSYPYLTIFTALSLTYLTLYISLSVPFRLPYCITSRLYSSEPTIDVSQVKFRSTQPTSILLQLLILSYILLFVPIAFLSGGQDVGSIYPLSALLTCAFAGWVIGVAGEIFVGIYGDDGVEVKRERVDTGEDDEGENAEAYHGDDHQERRYPRGVMYTAPHDREGTDSTVRPASSDWADQSAQSSGNQNGEEEHETEPTEITPLIQQRREAGLPLTDLRLREEGVGKEVARAIVWLLQVAVVVPIPAILIAHIALLMADGSSQAVVDGGGVGNVYTSFSVISLFLLLPLTPFFPAPSSLPPPPSKPKKRSDRFPDTTTSNGTTALTIIIFILFLISSLFTVGVFSLLSRAIGVSESYRPGFPFGVESPMKVYFQQQVEIQGDGGLVPSTTFTGVPYYMEKLVVPEVPSAHGEKGKGVECVDGVGKGKGGEGLRKCTWQHDLLPWPGAYKEEGSGSASMDEGERQWEEWWDAPLATSTSLKVPKNPYFRAKVSRSPDNGLNLTRTISVEGRNTRNCRIYFDSPTDDTPYLAKVKSWHVRGGDGTGSEVPGSEGEGVKEVRMWSRTWGREFVLDATFDEADRNKVLKGRVACQWTEYRSGLVEPRAQGSLEEENLVEEEKGELPSIPAYEEVLQNLPRWAVATKLADGLVEVWWQFEI